MSDVVSLLLVDDISQFHKSLPFLRFQLSSIQATASSISYFSLLQIPFLSPLLLIYCHIYEEQAVFHI